MSTRIVTINDLRAYFANARPDYDEGDVEAAVFWCQASSHPAYGSDWASWLAENDADITAEVLGGRI